MDPLSVAASIAGLLSAAGAVTKALAPYISAARETPKVAVHVHSEIQSITIIISALQGLAQNLESVPVQRAALIHIDHVVAVLTDGVLIFSELEVLVTSLRSLGNPSASITRLSLRSRLQWARKESEIASILARLQGFKSSASLILNILQSDSAIRAEESRTDLANNVNHLLESSKDVARRLMTLEDSFDARSMISRRRSAVVSLKLGHAEDDQTAQFLNRLSSIDDETISKPATSPASLPPSEYTTTSAFNFEPDLEASLAYRRAQRESMDFSFRSSVAWSNGFSTFSGLTLGDVSVLSVIALPIYEAEISNAHHYTFGNRSPSVPRITSNNRDESAPAASVNSLLYECLEIAIHLSQVCSSNHLWNEGLYFRQEHPFDVLRRTLAPGSTATQMIRELVFSTVEDASEFQAFIRGGDVDLLRALELVKAALASRIAPAARIEPFRVHALIRRKRDYSPESPALSDAVVEDFLAQERLFFHQLEDMPTVEKQMRLLNLLVEGRLIAIFEPLYEFMHIQLRFLLDIERNLLLPPESQRWSQAFLDWSLNTELLGKLIANETRTKWILRARLGSNEDPGQNFSPQVDAIAACFKLVSLPALAMLGHLEFLDTLEHHIDDSHTFRKQDISESRKVLLEAHAKISKAIKQEDLSHEFSNLRREMLDWGRLDLNQFGELLMYDDRVGVLDIRMIQRPHSQCRLYTFEKILIFVDEIAARRQTLRTLGVLGSQKTLHLTGRILLSNIKSIVQSVPNPGSTNTSDCSCLVVYTLGSDLEAFEIRFRSFSQMQTWAEEMRAVIQTPEQREQQHYYQHETMQAVKTDYVSTVPVIYPKAWKNTLLDRGYLSSDTYSDPK
ncbi:hypothetical protein V8F20_004143 [Naviculisporaceae sp. PSN 640]